MKSAKKTPLSPKVVALDGDFEHQFVHARGIRLHVATAGNPQNPLVLLLHDGLGGWFDFKDVLGPLAQRGWYAVALDMRGYGMSDKPPNSYDHRHATGDLAGVIRSLGHERAHLFGAGSGASIAWLFAAVYPDHVHSLTSIGAIHPLDVRRAIAQRPWLFGDTLPFTLHYRLPRFLQRMRPRFRQRLIERDLRNRTAKDFHHQPAFHQALELRKQAAHIGNTLPAREKTVRYVVNVPPVSWATLKVHCPVFLLTDPGAQSLVFLRRATSRVRQNLSSLSVVTGRLPHIEQPEEFVRLLDRILHSVVDLPSTSER
ncbi:MAG: alpha/beta hydrolase [Corynebacterium sp.]|nr:alpha/beta hydrolase [Corynebacterium sp.]